MKCLIGHKSQGSLYSVVKTLIVSGARPTDQGTRSPIELFWTAKKLVIFDALQLGHLWSDFTFPHHFWKFQSEPDNPRHIPEAFSK